MGEFNSDDHYIYYYEQESLRQNGVTIMVNKRVRNAVLGCNLKNDRMISVRIQVYIYISQFIMLYTLNMYNFYISVILSGLLWYWMVCLGYEQRSFCRFWDCIQVLHFGLLLTMMATPFLLRDSCLQSSELNSPIPVHFSSQIPRMSTFTLAISCLITSLLLWFMDLTFQVPMQCCSLQHQTLFLSPLISTTSHIYMIYICYPCCCCC